MIKVRKRMINREAFIEIDNGLAKIYIKMFEVCELAVKLLAFVRREQ